MVIQRFKIKLTVAFLLLNSCKHDKISGEEVRSYKNSETKKLTRIGKSKVELHFLKKGLVNIQSIDTSLRVDLRYSTPNNFVSIEKFPSK